MAERYALMWSGGKDSALALRRVRARGVNVTRLVNFYDPATDRVRFHATRSELIRAQAAAMGVELYALGVPWDSYEASFQELLVSLKVEGFAGVVFGDIHLTDVRGWYEERVLAAGLAHVEPIWGEPPAALLAEFVASGSRAVLTCVEITKLGEEWLGRVIDERFVAEVAATGIDPAGEHGEYHSFAYAGPLFKTPVRWRAGVRRSDGDFAQLDLELSPVGSRTPRSSARRLRRVRSTSS